MRFYLAGGGAREEALRHLLIEGGHQVSPDGAWDAVILALPRSEVPPDLARRMPPGQRIVCGLTDGETDALAKEKGWVPLRVLRDESYTLENAALTAEGALCAAMEKRPASLCAARCLIIGFGRIGQALQKLLLGIGAQVTVAARRQESRDQAGPGSVPIEQIPSLLPTTDVIFNTVPHPLLSENALRFVQPDALLIELASPPFGIDISAARRLGLNVHVESGVPGRYFPRSAAQALLRYLEREVIHHA
ncbi:MAG: hypothetical protein IJ662_07225 [Clostridia bacterium]|nr:hypothetical protein [Clostridia bacterium]